MLNRNSDSESSMTNHRYKIIEIAGLYSRAQWEKMQPLSDDNNGYFVVFVPSLSDGIRLDVRMLRGERPTQNGIILVIKDDYIEEVEPYYLCFELMSIIGNVVLLYDKEKKNYKNRITKSELVGFEMEVPDMEHQLAYADSAYFVDRLKAHLKTKDDDRYNQLRLSIFTEVMDALSIEQVMGLFFNDMGIHIYDPWKRLLEKYDRNDKQYMNKLFGELISQDSEVMNGVRKVRIAVKNISELYKGV